MEDSLTEITNCSVFSYSNEVLVEVHGYTEDGEFTAITYQFSPTETDEMQLQPRGQIDSAHEDEIQNILAEKGYTVV
ncbi:hypothetical protein [Halopelagius fulvigenes]|uniref:Uncharacterized protein n=1 Tax=Halopelagius fulvigenes TaxID=1198324 RepID=A0ABD5TY41_9EURY